MLGTEKVMAVSDKSYSRNTLLAKLHIAKAQLKLTDEQYRDILSNWLSVFTGEPCTSSKDLTDEQVIEVIDLTVKKLGWKPEPRKKKRPFINTRVPERFRSEFASPAQLEKIELLWVKYSQKKDKESLRRFVKRIAHVDLLESIQADQVAKIIKAIESL